MNSEIKATFNQEYLSTLCIPCIICGENVDLNRYEERRIQLGYDAPSKVCWKCKRAIMEMRERMGMKKHDDDEDD